MKKNSIIRIQKMSNEIKVYIKHNDHWISIDEVYGLVGDFDIRFPTEIDSLTDVFLIKDKGENC